MYHYAISIPNQHNQRGIRMESTRAKKAGETVPKLENNKVEGIRGEAKRTDRNRAR